ncbi:MAG: SDR family oxidoreductase [Chlorobi bacterium]|nr:SDR family oxidoreductase [Chlorobiota bacterium]
MKKESLYTGKVLVAGATGKTGQWVVKRLQHYGIPVRVLVRSAEKASQFGDSVEVAVGHVQNLEEVAAAVKGCDAVISALGSSSFFGESSPSQVDRDGTIRIADEAAKAGVRHFAMVSSMAVTRWYHPLNLFAGVLLMKYVAEEHVRSVFSIEGRSFTIVRPGGLKNGDPLTFRLHVEQGDRLWNGSTNRADVAELLVLSLWNQKAKHKTFEVINEEAEPQQSLEGYYEKLAG